MPHPPPPPSSASGLSGGVIHRRGIEDIAQTVKPFFDLDAVQLEAGDYPCTIDFIAGGRTFVYRENYPCRMHLRGELIGGRFGIAIPEGGPAAKFSGELMGGRRVATAMTGEEMDFHAQAGLRQIIMLVDRDQLADMAESAGLATSIVSSLRPGRGRMPLLARPQVVGHCSSALGSLLDIAAGGTVRSTPQSFDHMVMEAVLSMLEGPEKTHGRPPKAVLVRRAIEWVDSTHGPLQILPMCAALNVSHTTLIGAFRETTGLPPHAYFMNRSLNLARRQLLAAHPMEQSVTSIATRFGFTELGRFAVRYRQLFGESPSQSLSAAKKHHFPFAPGHAEQAPPQLRPSKLPRHNGDAAPDNLCSAARSR